MLESRSDCLELKDPYHDDRIWTPVQRGVVEHPDDLQLLLCLRDVQRLNMEADTVVLCCAVHSPAAARRAQPQQL